MQQRLLKRLYLTIQTRNTNHDLALQLCENLTPRNMSPTSRDTEIKCHLLTKKRLIVKE